MASAIYFQNLIDSLRRELVWFNAHGIKAFLFTNDIQPTSVFDPDDLVEPTASWYAGILLDEWDDGAVTYDAPRAKATHPQVTWVPDGTDPETVYGYFVRDEDDNYLWAEKFADGPFTVGPAAVQSLGVIPVYTRRSEYHST